MQAVPEAFLLLTLPNCTLQIKDFSETGALGLQCVTVPLPDASSDTDRDVYLVFRLNMSETPVDPARIIQRKDTHAARIYTFYGTPAEPNELVLTVPCPPGDANTEAPTPAIPDHPPPTYVSDQKDLRGHLVMINEETGEVIGEVEDRFRIQEDPVMYQRGHENDAVVIEVPDEVGLREGDANALAAFARIVPPDQQDWITKSATISCNFIDDESVGHDDHYCLELLHLKVEPSPHHSSANLTTPNSGNEKRSTSPVPPPLPPRALVFLTSDRTRKNLRGVHTVSGQAVKISAKTVNKIDNMIRRAMGARPKENRLRYVPAGPNSLSPVPYASTSPGPASGSAPYAAYTPVSSSSTLLPGGWNSDTKPSLPPRSNSPYAPPSAPGSPQPLPSQLVQSPCHPPISFTISSQQYQQHSIADRPVQPKLTTTRRLLISADLILSTIDDSTRKILDSGTNNLGKVMHHKYGAEAAESSLLMAGTARNVGLVYIDMSGIGRRALLRRVGMSFVKGRVQNKDDGKRPVPPIPGQKP
ncbi:hypothetical protein D9756_011254 [Leucocoprinus leucothites]|uniref:Senescence domain-containing protein n=1 Tax=Leucocoprinus leucothites TaxID=201217 RepID=A0A8H5CPB1_9AGAR|nr:hypothetical protein D9756_011254 [Leucoagaricus leucothites]